MTSKIPFPGTAGLNETETTVAAYQLGMTANLIEIEGRIAEFEDGTRMNVNVAEFDPVDHRTQIRKQLAFVLVANVDFAAMAAAGMTQLGGPNHPFTIFVSDVPQNIYIFARL